MSTVNIKHRPQEVCPKIGYQTSSICVPVTVKPFAVLGTAVTSYCGDPVIIPGTLECSGVVNGTCTFTIAQNICTAVPIEFGASAQIENVYVQCGETSNEDICQDCNDLI
jgi:hypothetical protein